MVFFRNDDDDGPVSDPSEEEPGRVVPLLPLRNIVVYPNITASLFVGRQQSIRALDEAMNTDSELLLAAQREHTTEDPREDDIYSVGTLGKIIQLLPLPDGTRKVIVEGRARARIRSFVRVEPYLACDVELLEEEDTRTTEIEALLRSIHTAFETYVKFNKKVPPELLSELAAVQSPAHLADRIVAQLDLKIEDKQRLLEVVSPAKRLEEVYTLLQAEIEVLQVERKIRSRVKKQMERSQKEYYLNEQMRAIQKELGERDEFKSEIHELEEALKNKDMPEDAEDRARKEIRKLKMMSPMSAEATVVRNYVDWILSLPWNETKEDKTDLDVAQRILDEDHYGLEKPKERILEYLAVQSLVDRMKGPILCFVGPPGVGKTSLGRSIARATDRDFVRISLGGVRDEAEIRGHRRTYIGALPGKIIQSLKKAGSSNPVFLLDEVDKMSMDFRGDPSSALLEVLDPEQNHTFNDHYLDMDYDLSRVMFICCRSRGPSWCPSSARRTVSKPTTSSSRMRPSSRWSGTTRARRGSGTSSASWRACAARWPATSWRRVRASRRCA
jgi:ATP-dependent Lon protease